MRSRLSGRTQIRDEIQRYEQQFKLLSLHCSTADSLLTSLDPRFEKEQVMPLTGIIQDGKVVLDEPLSVPEGTRVRVSVVE